MPANNLILFETVHNRRWDDYIWLAMIFLPAWENNSLEKLIDIFPKVALLLCFTSSPRWKMFWFLLHLESSDYSPTHLSLNFVGGGRCSGGKDLSWRSTVKCACIRHTAPTRIIIFIAFHFPSWAPFWKHGLTLRRRVNTFKRIWRRVMEEKTLPYCEGLVALCWAYGGARLLSRVT